MQVGKEALFLREWSFRTEVGEWESGVGILIDGVGPPSRQKAFYGEGRSRDKAKPCKWMYLDLERGFFS